jgi:hypothetical protein
MTFAMRAFRVFSNKGIKFTRSLWCTGIGTGRCSLGTHKLGRRIYIGLTSKRRICSMHELRRAALIPMPVRS